MTIGLEGAAMHALSASGMTALASRLTTGHGCLLVFHRGAKSSDWTGLPNRDFYVDTSFLDVLLRHLITTGWAIVSMDEAVERVRDGDRSRFVNFSIDDVYRDTVEAVVPVFRDNGVPVTLYVTTGIPDGTMSLWQAGLETILHERESVSLEDGSNATTADDTQKRDWFRRLSSAWDRDQPEIRYQRFCALNGFAPDVLRDRHAVTWSMLETLRDDPCVEIGGHTVNHPHLAQLEDADAREEIVACKTRLDERLGRPIRHFAFPYGQSADCGPREFAITQEAGLSSASTTRRGLVGPANRDRLHSLPRNNLNGRHRDIALIQTHLSGLGGLLATAARSLRK